MKKIIVIVQFICFANFTAGILKGKGCSLSVFIEKDFIKDIAWLIGNKCMPFLQKSICQLSTRSFLLAFA